MKYFVDIDDTICTTVEGDYASAQPIMDRIQRINALYNQGNEVVYWTARGVGSGLDFKELTISQLQQWGAEYSELRMDKPVFDLHIDDKAIRAEEYFSKKTVAIVCGAAYMRGFGQGEEIDSKDLVVRVNLNYQVAASHPKDLGRRTDIIYFCGSLWGKRLKHQRYIPKGAKIVKVNQAIPGAQDKKARYVANTGVRAVIDYAIKGFSVYVYGMDFYAEINNGTILKKPIIRSYAPIIVDSSKIYLNGYNGSSRRARISHIGGIRDVELLLKYQKDYDIHFDEHTKEVIKKNTLISQT